MKTKKRRKMKNKRITKLFSLIFLLFSIFIRDVKAEENINISSHSTIKYKWYIEEKVDERYSAKGYSSDEYYEELNATMKLKGNVYVKEQT